MKNIDKTAMVTGATSGIGLSTSHKLADLGYNLIIMGRDREKLDSLTINLRKRTVASIQTICVDLSEPASVKFALDSNKNTVNVDVLVNCAGVSSCFAPISKIPVEDIENDISTNFTSLVLITQFVIHMMQKKRSGDIVNVSSSSAHTPLSNESVYCASKSAVSMFSNVLNKELSDSTIRVLDLCPGTTRTNFLDSRMSGNSQMIEETYGNLTPLEPDDIADIIAFFLSLPKHVCITNLIVRPTEERG